MTQRKVEVLNSVSTLNGTDNGPDAGTGEWEVCFEQIKLIPDPSSYIHGFRFISKRPNGDYYYAGNQTLITQPEILDGLIHKAIEAGWYERTNVNSLTLPPPILEKPVSEDNSFEEIFSSIIDKINLHLSKVVGYYQCENFESAVKDTSSSRFNILYDLKILGKVISNTVNDTSEAKILKEANIKIQELEQKVEELEEEIEDYRD